MNNLESELLSTRTELDSLHALVSTMANSSIETNVSTVPNKCIAKMTHSLEKHLLQSLKSNNRIAKPSLSVDVSRGGYSNTRRDSITPTAAMPTGFVLPRTAAGTPNTEMKRHGYFDLPAEMDSPPPSPHSMSTPKTSGTQRSNDLQLGTPVSDKDALNTPTNLKSPFSVDSPSSDRKPKTNATLTRKTSTHDTCLQVLRESFLFSLRNRKLGGNAAAAVKKYSLRHPWYEYSMIVSYGNNRVLVSGDHF